MQIKLIDIEPRPVWVVRDKPGPFAYYRAVLPARMTGGVVKDRIWTSAGDLCDRAALSRIEKCSTLEIRGFGTPTVLLDAEWSFDSNLRRALVDVSGVIFDWDDNLMASPDDDLVGTREALIQSYLIAIATGDSTALENVRGPKMRRFIRDFSTVFKQRPAGVTAAQALMVIREQMSKCWPAPETCNVRSDLTDKLAATATGALRSTRRLIASTGTLAGVMSQAAPDADIRVAPNVIDPADFHRNPKPNDGKVRIGYCAGPLHKQDAYLILPALKQCAALPNVEIYFFGWHPNFYYDFAPTSPKCLEFEGMPYRHGGYVAGSVPQFQREIGILDVALAPLKDTEVNRCKSPQKWFESACNATPMVVSDSPAYECVEHGVTGFKASTAEEFTEYAVQLCKDAELRKRIGEAAYDAVMARHTVTSCADVWRAAVAP